MSVEKAKDRDLRDVFKWLEREYLDDGEGFWSNRLKIEQALSDGDLWVIRQDGEAVAFQVGNYSADIVNVKRELQFQGFGTQLFEASLARAFEDNVNVLFGECYPRRSLTYWQKHGFNRYGDMNAAGPIPVRRVLRRAYAIPPNLPSATINIDFCSEGEAGSTDEKPFASFQPRGAWRDGRTVLLDQRVIVHMADVPGARHVVVNIEVDGRIVCSSRAVDDLAKRAGLNIDLDGCSYYADNIHLSE